MYGIATYKSLVPLLGYRWHIRVLNDRMNFCYAMLESVHFHLHQRRALPDYQPDQTTQSVDGGFVLVFSSVRMDCVKRQWEEVLSID